MLRCMSEQNKVPFSAAGVALAVHVVARPAPSPIQYGGAALRKARKRHEAAKVEAEQRLASWGFAPDGAPLGRVAP